VADYATSQRAAREGAPGVEWPRGRDRALARLFHRLCTGDPAHRNDPEDYFATRAEATDKFFRRLPPWLDVEDKRVLDVGCGEGITCLEVARRGASRVLGVDIGSVDFAQSKLDGEYADVADRCEFRRIASLDDVRPERFDVVISQDSFEHYADPEDFAPELASLLDDGGLLVVGFGPLWKSPDGAHIGGMTRVPWVHLMFPEHIVMAERRRYRPEEEVARFEEIKGGLNKMTLARFERIMRGTGLEPVYFETNRGDHPAMRVFSALARIRPLREYFTANLYSVWRASPG
jgi:SAM-dependent methyltransferase